MYKTLDDFIKYLSNKRSGSKRTSDAYYRDIARFITFLNDNNIKDFEDVDKNVVHDYISLLRSGKITKTKLSDSSYARNLSSLRSFYKYLNVVHKCDVNPFLSVKKVHASKHLPDVLTYEEVMQVLNSFDLDDPLSLRNKTIVETLYCCGLRISELCDLKLDDIDFKEMCLRVIGKGNKERIVPFPSMLKESFYDYLEKYRSINAKDNVSNFFVSKRGGKISPRSVQLLLDDVSKKCGLKVNIHPHVFRHSFATHLLDNGADIRVVQELLGHENLSTTELYTHLTYERLNKTIKDFHPHSKYKVG